MKNIRKYIGLAMIIAIVVEGLLLKQALNKAKKMESNWVTAQANVKSYDELQSTSERKNAAFLLTIDQLSNAKDSVLRILNETRKDLKIKDKNVKSLQYVSSVFTKTDTITLSDTIFRETINNKYMTIDTIIGDQWYSTNIKMEYPSTIILKPEFKSDKNIIVHTKRETVNPPKKWWLLRLFQKKHTVLKIDVIEKNPYIQQENSRYIEIIK